MTFEFWVRLLVILFALAVLVMLILKYQNKGMSVTKKKGRRNLSVSEEDEDVVEEEETSKPTSRRRKEHFTNETDYATPAPVPDMKKASQEQTKATAAHAGCPQTTPKFEKPFGSDVNMGESSVQPLEALDNEEFKAVDFDPAPKKFTPDCYPKERLSAEDLLPKDASNSKWAQVNPAGQGDLMNQNFLQPEARFGIDTVGQSLRNPNMQLRNDPFIPKIEGISPWMNSTIEYDYNRRPFEIGGI